MVSSLSSKVYLLSPETLWQRTYIATAYLFFCSSSTCQPLYDLNPADFNSHASPNPGKSHFLLHMAGSLHEICKNNSTADNCVQRKTQSQHLYSNSERRMQILKIYMSWWKSQRAAQTAKDGKIFCDSAEEEISLQRRFKGPILFIFHPRLQLSCLAWVIIQPKKPSIHIQKTAKLVLCL